VVDIRHDYERRVSTVAHAISVAEFRRRAELGEHDDFIMVTCCIVGVRSLKFVVKEVQNMNDMGVTPAYELTNLRFGLLSWIHAGYPVVDPSGLPVKRFHCSATTSPNSCRPFMAPFKRNVTLVDMYMYRHLQITARHGSPPGWQALIGRRRHRQRRPCQS